MRSVDFADDCAEFLSGARFQIPYPPMRDEKCAETEEALRQAWRLIDSLGEHQSDEDRLAILRSQEFALTANRVRMAVLKIATTNRDQK